MKDEQHWGNGGANKGPLEETLISAGRLLRKVSSVHAFSAGVGLPLPGQLSSAFQLLNRIEGAFTQPAQSLPSKGVVTTVKPCQRYVSFPPSKGHRRNCFLLRCRCMLSVCMRSLSSPSPTAAHVGKWDKTPPEGQEDK